MMAKADSPSFLQRVAYCLPAAPLAALGLPLYALVPTFYTETIGLPLAQVGLVLLFIRIFDAVSDPVAGVLADRYRPAFGRRRLFFAMSLPVCAIAAFMLYSPPADAGLWWLGFWGAALSLGFTLASVPYAAWGAELVTGYRQRSDLASLREGLTLVGTLIAIVVPFAIGMRPGDAVSGLAVLGAIIAVSLPAFGLVAIWLVPEPVETSTRRLVLKDSLGHLWKNRPFLRLVLAFFLNGFANGIPATLFLYFVSDRLGMPEARGPLLFLYFLFAIAGVPLSAVAVRAIGKHRAWCLAMIAACAVFSVAPFLPPGSIYAFGAICVLTGVLLGFDLAIPPAIQADVIDNDTAVSGEQRSGLYFSAWGLATKLSLAAGVGLVFPLLGSFGFDPAKGVQNTPSALDALAVAYAFIPVALKLAAIVLMWNFPLDEKAQTELRLRIDAGNA